MRRIIKNILPIILPILFLIGWQILSKRINNQIILPSVNSIVKIIIHPKQDLISIGSLYRNTYVSLIRVGIGYIFAIIVAIPIGVLIGYSRTMERLLSTFLNLFRPIPPLAWVPLVLAWFGIASFATLFNIDIYNPNYSLLNGIKISMIFIIFIGAFFPILTNTVYGIRTVRKTLIDSALTLGAKNIDILTKVLLPGAMPSILTGLRVGLGVAWMCLISAEMLPGSIAGVGYLITHAYQVTRIDIVIAGIISISTVGTFFDLAFQKIEKECFKWQRLSR